MPPALITLIRRHVEATEEFLRITVFDGEHATIGRLATAMGEAARAVRDALDGQDARPGASAPARTEHDDPVDRVCCDGVQACAHCGTKV